MEEDMDEDKVDPEAEEAISVEETEEVRGETNQRSPALTVEERDIRPSPVQH